MLCGRCLCRGVFGREKTPEEISVEAVPVGTMIVCKIRNPEAFSVSASESKYLEAFGGTDAKRMPREDTV